MERRYLYSVDRVDILHAIEDYSPDFLERFVWAHYANGASLNQDITLRQ